MIDWNIIILITNKSCVCCSNAKLQKPFCQFCQNAVELSPENHLCLSISSCEWMIIQTSIHSIGCYKTFSISIGKPSFFLIFLALLFNDNKNTKVIYFKLGTTFWGIIFCQMLCWWISRLCKTAPYFPLLFWSKGLHFYCGIALQVAHS